MYKSEIEKQKMELMPNIEIDADGFPVCQIIAKPIVSRRSETIKNFGKILDIMNRYKDEVDNGIYDHQDAMIEEIICRFTIVPNDG